MSTILDKIIANTRKEVERMKPLSSIQRFRKEGFFWEVSNRSLVDTLTIPGSTGIIAEFKRRSPSKGWFKPEELEVEPVIAAYNSLGAAGISVLTDHDFFGGDLDDLIQAKVITDVPVLRKDFIIDEWQIAEAKAFGADVILLIASALTVDEVKRMATFARTINLEVLLEIHNEEELLHICDEVSMVGVNNRNLKTFEVNIDISLELIDRIPRDKPAVAESGISDVDTIITLKNAGFKGFLIGETFMKAEEPGKAFAGFVEDLRSRG